MNHIECACSSSNSYPPHPTHLPSSSLSLTSRSILDDVRWLLGDSVHTQNPSDPQTLDPWFGPVRHASDYFHTIHEAAVYLIKSGLAYVDDLTPGRQEGSSFSV
jgi:glutamyl/glutaminyl-tRNA synthetase